MATILPAGPYEQIDLGGGMKAPLYIIPFDKDGLCTGPQTRKALVQAVKTGGFSDVFLFSHGWNNDWPTATQRYRDFFAAFRKVREQHGGTPEGYRPLLVGVFWPSTALVFGEEKGPDFAGGPVGGGPDDEEVKALTEATDEIARQLDPAVRERFYELATAEALTQAEATELASLLLPFYLGEADPEEGKADLDAEALVAQWRQLPDEAADEEDENEAPRKKPKMVGVIGVPTAGPQAAGGIGSLIGFPRQAVRAFTVYQMKDRAGVVGAKGVAPLLRDLLTGGTEVHLIGHSYGCKVVLSAICGGPPLADGAVASLLLLQPAVNFWCFAKDVDGEGFPGGYRDAFRAVRQPILQTWSKHDVPLHRTFHLAVTRKKDLGEVKAAGPLHPERYGALGGWGPRGCPEAEAKTLPLPKVGETYPDLSAETPQLYALDGGGNDTVMGHGDVTSPHAAWALLQQVRTRP